MAGTTIEQRINAAVAHALAQENGRLEQLVDHAVDRALAELVQERLHARNGNGGPAVPDRVSQASDSVSEAPDTPAAAPAGQRRCKECGETKPLARFDPHRHTCKTCRNRRARERKTTAAANGDGP